MTRLIGRHPAVSFFFLAFIISRAIWVPLAFDHFGVFASPIAARVMAIARLAGTPGPALAASILARIADGRGGVAAWFSSLDTFSVSAVTLEELVFGLRRRSMLAKEAWPRRMLADRADVVPVTVAAAHWNGGKSAMLESGGRTVAQVDALMAACAWELVLILATRNVEDFRGFGVPLYDPFEQAATH